MRSSCRSTAFCSDSDSSRKVFLPLPPTSLCLPPSLNTPTSCLLTFPSSPVPTWIPRLGSCLRRLSAQANASARTKQRTGTPVFRAIIRHVTSLALMRAGNTMTAPRHGSALIACTLIAPTTTAPTTVMTSRSSSDGKHCGLSLPRENLNVHSEGLMLCDDCNGDRSNRTDCSCDLCEIMNASDDELDA